MHRGNKKFNNNPWGIYPSKGGSPFFFGEQNDKKNN